MELPIKRLPADVQRLIYEYDDTYRPLFRRNVLDQMWKTAWSRWARNLHCPYRELIADWWMNAWNCHNDFCYPYKPLSCEIHVRNYFPDNVDILLSHRALDSSGIRICTDYQFFLDSFVGSLSISKGVIYREEHDLEDDKYFPLVLVHENPESGLLLAQYVSMM